MRFWERHIENLMLLRNLEMPFLNSLFSILWRMRRVKNEGAHFPTRFSCDSIHSHENTIKTRSCRLSPAACAHSVQSLSGDKRGMDHRELHRGLGRHDHL